ncbi:hypothetical protein ACQ5SO_17135 [Rhodovulum sp. DZ06]|uniref:hypothetical protein n=1 Tax=Rhodovulum sp. DZ06 TaxID=3425126 RepID=UPI003D3423BB
MTLPRPQRPGSYHGMISDLLDACGRRAVEAETGHQGPTLSRWADPSDENGRRMPVAALDQVCRLFPDGAAVVARHFAALAGGSFVPEGAGTSPSAACADLSASVAEATGLLLAALDPAGPGGAAMTARERADLSDAAQHAIDAARSLQAALREGER